MMNAEEFPVVLFSSQDGDVRVNAVLRDRTLWLTQKSMAGLFGVKSQAITKHLKNIYATSELQIAATCSKMEQVQSEGGRRVAREMVFYNLDAIIAVGYRVNSYLATQFRIWATKVLTEYITKGFVLDDNRLKKGGNPFGEDYFRELLERVRSIRASERRIWQQITDIYAECSIDYDRNAPTTRDFYAMVQNKFHYAITGETAAEIVHSRADAAKAHMGLKSWRNAPDGRILKSDVIIAKNYLSAEQVKELEGAVVGYFDYIERIIKRHQTFTMEEFARSVNAFLEFNEYEILEGMGSVSRAKADEKAYAEYDEFNRHQQIESDFDRQIKLLLDGGNA